MKDWPSWIYQIIKFAFRGLTSLQTLDLQCNKIGSLLANRFADLKNLVMLNFGAKVCRQNESVAIPNLESYVFNGLGNLPHLQLSDSNISRIKFLAFVELQYLVQLDLTNNTLSCLSNNTFTSQYFIYAN